MNKLALRNVTPMGSRFRSVTSKLALAAASLAMAGLAKADDAIDITGASTAITTAKGYITTLGGAAISIAVLFLTIKLVRRAVSKV